MVIIKNTKTQNDIIKKFNNNGESFFIQNYNFKYICDITPNNNDDKIIEYVEIYKRYKKYNSKSFNIDKDLHAYGNLTFCKFKINSAKIDSNPSGVYALVCKDKIIYIGETKKIKTRFNNGYGTISPRNCYKGGQRTNCRINNRIYEMSIYHQKIKLYFYECANYKEVEKLLLNSSNKNIQIITEENIKNNN